VLPVAFSDDAAGCVRLKAVEVPCGSETARPEMFPPDTFVIVNESVDDAPVRTAPKSSCPPVRPWVIAIGLAPCSTPWPELVS
jgi:hypothetical protein